MAAQTGRYYSALFTGSRGATHGKPLSPTIFNMVVDAVIRHWATRVTGEDSIMEGFGRAVQKLSALFYVECGLLASPRPSRLQESLETPTGLFVQVSLRTNVAQMVGIVCQPLRYAGIQSEEVYQRRMTGEGCN